MLKLKWFHMEVLFSAFCLWGCGSGGGSADRGGSSLPSGLDAAYSTEATGRLASTSFPFPAGSGIFEPGDPRESMSSLLTIGRLDSSSSIAAFTVTSPDGSSEGGYFFGLSPCSFEFVYSRRAGAAPIVGSGFRDSGYFDQCGIDLTGRLALLAPDNGAYLVSEPGRPTGTDSYRTVALTEAAVVQTLPVAATGAHGAVEFTLSGQVLSYSAGIQGLAGTESYSLTIHTGSSTETTPAVITLVGFSNEPLRDLSFHTFANGVATGSVLLSESEAAAFSDGLTEYYVQVSSTSHPNGLLRGQIVPQISPLSAPLVLADDAIASGAVIGESPQTITVSLGGGSSATLSAPVDAAGKSSSLSVVMAPVRAAIGLPFVGGALAGVKLSPDQTRFEEPLTLRFDIMQGFNPHLLAALSIDGISGEATFLPLSPGAVHDDSIEVVVNHFSDIMVGNVDPESFYSGMPPSPEYRHWREQIARLLSESEARQLLGNDALPVSEINLVLVTAYSETILPNINAISDADSFDRAFLDFKAWIADIQTFGSYPQFIATISDAAIILASKIEAVVAVLEQRCLNSVDPCEKLGILRDYANWVVRAQILETLGNLTVNIPPYEQFCDGLATQQGAGIRLVVTPSPLFALPGTGYDFDVVAIDENQVNYPVPQAQWSISPVSANTIDSASGQGVAVEAGVYEISVFDPGICADPGKSILNIKDFTGTWDVVQRAESVTCPEDFRLQRNYQVEIVQNSDSVLITHPTFGPVNATITGYSTIRSGTDVPLFGIDTGMVVSPTTNFCGEFFQDVGVALNDSSCNPPNTCVPLSCQESYDVSGLFDEYGNTLTARNQWSDNLSWNISGPDSEPVLIETFCSGADNLSLTRFRQ